MAPLPLRDVSIVASSNFGPFWVSETFSHTSLRINTLFALMRSKYREFSTDACNLGRATRMWIIFFLNILAKINICMKKRIISENLELLEKPHNWEMHFKKGGNMFFIIFVSEIEEQWTMFFSTKSLIINVRFKKKKKKKMNVAASRETGVCPKTGV